MPVVKIESLEGKKGFDSNLDLETCDNNGGRRIFPGKLLAYDASAPGGAGIQALQVPTR